MTNIDNSQQIAETILEQLGGSRFRAMTGAKDLSYGGNGLNMRIGRNVKGVTHVHVALKADDTYTVVFMAIRGHKITEKAKHEGIYCDMLRDVFERETGMYTSLGTMGRS